MPPFSRMLLTVIAVLALSACGGSGEQRPAGGDTTATAALPTDTTDIRDEPLTPAVLKDPRIETLRPAERHILRAYLARMAQLQQRRADSGASAGSTAQPGSLMLDTNLTVGEVISMNRGTERVEPQPPRPLPERGREDTPAQVQE